MSKYIVKDPNILGGKPIIKGTRLGVNLIKTWLGNGSSIEEIINEFPQLTEEAIKETMSL